jgi:F-type H+/Na+-transporting ATPase subunit alpha
VRPALNVGISVSRVGSSAQTKAMKQVAGKMKLELAAFRELAAFAQFASDLDRTTRAQLERGLRSQEVLKQPQFAPFSLAKEVTIIYALTNGFLDDVPIENVRAWENEFHRFMETAHPEIADTVAKEKTLSDSTIAALRAAIEEFKQQVVI